MRADVYLAEKGLCQSRSRAQSDISSGRLYVNGKCVTKSSFDISDGDTVELRGEDMPYVGRGGLKLKGALDVFGKEVFTQEKGVFRVSGHVFCPNGKICADIGASTGGFTDCLLQNGAKRVYAIDCGSGQLHESLVSDPRVVNIENFNARELNASVTDGRVDVAVMDVSFISQTLILPAIYNILKDGGELISLIKPQFEAGKSALGHKGIVKNDKYRISAVKNVILAARALGFALAGLAGSPIKGGDGNTEYLAYFVKDGTRHISEISDKEIENAVTFNFGG